MIQRSPNHTRGRTPCALSSSGRVSVACSNSAMPRLAPQLLAEEERRVGADGELDAGDRLGGVPVLGELLGVDQLVQLHAGARRLGRDRVGVCGEPLDAVDRDLQVLAAGGEDLLVEQRVARVRAERAGVQVLLAERRQDADDHHVRADRARLVLGLVQAAADPLLERREHLALEQPRRDVDLDVELPELGDEVVVGDLLQHLGVRHGGIAGLVGQVQLDLEPDRAVVGVEARLPQHAREDVEVALDLVAIALPVLTAEHRGRDVFPHGWAQPTR